MSLSFSVLRLHDFRLLLAARVFGTMAMTAQAVIVGWQIYSLTRDPFLLGLVGLTEAVPAIICALFAGHVVDNSRPYLAYLACVCVMALNMLLLFLIGGGIVPVVRVVPWLFAGVFVSGIARSFRMPATFALLPKIVSKAELSAASAWLVSFFQVGAISGPAVAGLVYGGYGARAAWLIPVTLITGEFMALIAMSGALRRMKGDHRREPALRSIRAGWSFILSNRVLLAVMALDMFAVLLGGAVAMLPAFADQVLHVGSEGLGYLRAAPAIGGGITAFALALWPMKHIRATTLLWAVAGFGLCMIGFGMSVNFWLSLALLAASGAFDSVSMVIRSTLMQFLVPDHMRGRVSAVNSMFIISSNEIGAFESGLAARLLGLVPSVIAGGLGTLAIVAITARIRAFRTTVVKG